MCQPFRALECYIVAMTATTKIYDFPNVGCLLGSAYQQQVSNLASALDAARLDVSPAEYMVLRALYSGAPMQQCELWRTIGKDKAAVCRTVAAMVKKGLVSVTPVSRKCSMVSVTAKGEGIRPAIMEVAGKMHLSLAQKLSDDDFATLQRILEQITK